jgi:dolichyl-phosphooligosaccharide-protein glycotransferase
MEGKDDEISIDFGKIKNFFKRKKEKKKLEQTAKQESNPQIEKEIKETVKADNEEIITDISNKDEEEISIDFNKIKNIFRSKTLEAKTSEEKTISTENKDDEINLDFGKIKNIFKKKDPVAEKSEPKENTKAKEDDEISFDLSKLKNIKNIFKGSKTETSYDKEDNISIDFKKLSGFFVEYRALIFILIPIFLSIFLRVQSAYLPETDRWATESVINEIRAQISSQINQQYPNLPQQNKDALIDNELQKLLQEQGAAVDQQIYAGSLAIKSRLQDDTGQTYLLAIDPYFWMRHARNILENGHPGDEIRDGRPYDNHMLAPEGRGVPFDMFHAYFIAFLFKIMNFFSRDLNLMAVTFFTPVIISALSVIPAFFITRKITGNFGAFVAALIVAIHPSFLSRTAGGFADTDAYNVMFPLFIAWIFLEALEAKTAKKVTILSIASGLLVGLYSMTWGGWWYIFDFILITTTLYIAYFAFVHRRELIRNFRAFVKQKAIKNSLTFMVIFFIAAGISVSFFVSYGQFKKFYTNPTGFAKLKEVGITTIWPNVFTTVAEQNPASLNNVINQVGLGEFYFFLIALMGITLTLTTKGRKKLWFVSGTLIWYLIVFFLKVQNLNTFLVLISIPILIRMLIALWESDKNIDIKYAIFLILWFIATTFASTKGVRFTLLMVPVFAIGFGIALGELYRYASSWISNGLHINRYLSKIVMAFIVLIIAGVIPTPWPPFCLGATCQSAINTARGEIPSFDDAWATSLEKIKEESEPNAIINSWWDFGHWFKYWADRPVTFDGTSQNTPPAHWIGRVLLTDDENLAIGILRMLDCSSREGFNTVAKHTKDGTEAINVMYEILPLSKERARRILTDRFSKEDSEEILKKTHCEPPENYFITSEDMVGKSGVWAHFGSWDFDRALIYNTLKRKGYDDNLDESVKFLKERFDYQDNDAEDLFYEVQSITTSDQANSWIAPWPGYAGTSGCSKESNETYMCAISGIPLMVNVTSNEAYADSSNGRLHPKMISFPTDQGLIVKEYNESVISLQNGRNLGVALIKEGENYRAVAMDSDLTASIFTRLFYQEGIGLKHFDRFSDETSTFGSRIIVWKVDWQGK